MDIILVPGLWLDGSSWDEVVPALEEAGHRTHPLTLPGMESRDADRSGITLRDHVDATVRVIDSVAPPSRIALVGHSGGGAVIHGAIDVRADRISRAVYVDCWPVGPGGVINDQLPAEGGEVPLPDWAAFDAEDLVDLDEGLRAAFRERAIPSPARVARDKQQLSDKRRYEVPAVVIACEFPSAKLQEWMEQGEPSLRELSKIHHVRYLDLPTGHWPQFTRPKELGQAILSATSN